MKVIAVDLGATNLRVAVFDDGTLIESRRIRTPRSGGKGVIADAIIRLARELPISGAEAVGIASIGPIDSERGWVVNTPNNPIKSFPLREPIEEGLGLPVHLYNDCVAAVWGEKVLGRGRVYRDLGYITISTGIGGGFIVDDRLIHGRRGNAHEVGHIVVDLDSGMTCGCGGRGHWEAIASGTAIPSTARIYAGGWSGPPTRGFKLASKGRLKPEILYKLARIGDEFAVSLVEYLNRVHAAGIASVIAAYDPEAIFLGGSIFLYNQDLILEPVRRMLREYSIWSTRLEPATFRENAVLYGAAAVALKPPRR